MSATAPLGRDDLYRKALSVPLSCLTDELRAALIEGQAELDAAHAWAKRTTFRAIPCSCGHAPAGHARGGRSAPPGRCYECGCPRYEDADLAAYRRHLAEQEAVA